MRIQYCFSLFLFLIVCTACEIKTDTPKEPTIEWIEDSFSVKGNYLMGGFAGYGFKGQFKVVGETGNVEIAVEVENQNTTKVASTFKVFSGETYEISVVGDVDGSIRDTKPQDCDIRVIFSSQNASEELTLDIFGYNISDEFITYYFCPTLLSFGEISVK